MKTNIILDKDSIELVTTGLAELFPKTENSYSIGFQRWTKLTKKQLKEISIYFDFNIPAIKNALQTQTFEDILGQ
jgi:hypothetical protein